MTSVAPTLFKLDADAPVASAEEMARFTSDLSSVSTVSTTKATAVMASQVDQKVVSVDGTVVSSEDRRMGDKGSPAISMRVIVERVHKDDADGNPAEDLVSYTGAPFETLLTTEGLKHPDKAMVAMPRVINTTISEGVVGVKMVPLAYIDASYFKNAKDGDDLSAASVPIGTRVRLTGVTAKIAGGTKKSSGAAVVNFKKFNILELCDNPINAPDRIEKAMAKPGFRAWQAMEAVPMVGGLENMVSVAPLVGSDLSEMTSNYREGVVQSLDEKATSLAPLKVGVGEKYETEFCSPANLAVISSRALDLRDNGTPFMPLGAVHDNGIVKIPFHHHVRSPAESHPEIMKKLADMPDEAKMLVVPHVTQVNVDKTFVKMFLALGYVVPGKRGLQAVKAGQRPIFGDDPFTPACGVKMSLKGLAVMFGTHALSKATYLAKELLPFADFFVSVPSYGREAGESVFGDDSGGLNWSDLFTLNMPTTLAKTALLLTPEYVQSRFGGGESNIESEEPASNDVCPLPEKNSPMPPSLRRLGFMPASEGGTYSMARNAKPDRLPPGCTAIEYRLVFDGVADAIAKDPSLAIDAAEAEKFLNTKFNVNPDAPEESSAELLKKTVLYAVAVDPAKRAREVTDSASTDDVSGDEGSSAPAAAMAPPAVPAAKKPKKQK